MNLNLFFNGLSVPDPSSELFTGKNAPFEKFIRMLSRLWSVTHINMTIQTDIKTVLCNIAIPYNRSRDEHHFWKLFLDRSCDIKWQDETLAIIYEKGRKCFIAGDPSTDAMVLFGAVLENLLAVSFCIDDRFSSHEICLVNENKQCIQSINNMSSIHTAKLVIRKRSNELSSKDEIPLFDIIYPNLQFCDIAKKDYSSRNSDFQFKKQTRTVLEALDKCVEETIGGIMDVKKYCPDVSPDTPASLEGDKGERKVRCPDGKDFVFSFHVKPRTARIYYDVRYSPERFILIGRILPVSQHPS